MATPRTQHRVQVGDLAPPDRLVPGGIVQPGFAAPAQPPINNNLERLASSLGGFSSALMAAGRRLEANAEAERKKAEAELQARRDADFLKWTMSATTDEQLNAYLNGTAPIDFVTEGLYRKHRGGLFGDHFAQSVQAEITEGNLPIGREGFEVDPYVLERARPFLDQLEGDEIGLKAFSSKFDAVGDELREAHRKGISAERVEAHKTVAKEQIRQTFTNAVLSGLEGEELMDGFRQIYTELGPRMEGGGFNFNAAEMDGLVLDVIEELAEDPRYAQRVVEFLHTDRKDLADSNLRIGSLGSIKRHEEQSRRIREKARKTLAKEVETDFKAQVLMEDLGRLVAEDGSFEQITDHEEPNPLDAEKPIKLTAKERQDAAVALYLEQRRAVYGADLKGEIEVLMRNGVKHEEVFKALEGAFGASVGSEMSPEQLQRVVAASDVYMSVPYSYAEQHLNEKTRNFYEAIRVGMSTGLTAEEAAMAAGRVYSEGGGRGVSWSRDQMTTIRSASKISQGGFMGFGGSRITNAWEAEKRIQKLASIYVTAHKMDPDKAITAASERIAESTPIVNGRAIFDVDGIGLTKGDEENIQIMLEADFERNPALMAHYGIESASELSLSPAGRRTLIVVRAADGQPILDPSTGQPLARHGAADVRALSAERAKAAAEENDRRIKEIATGPRRRTTSQETSAPRLNSPAGEAVKSFAHGLGKAATIATQGLVNSAASASRGAAVPRDTVRDAYSIGQPTE